MDTKRMSTEERQKEILNTTLEIVHEEGYKNLTVRNIASRINITEPAIYRHFDNKKDIVTNLAKKVFEEGQIRVNPEEYGNPFELLRDILLNHFERLERNPHITAILYQSEIFREYPEIKQLFITHSKKNEETLISIVKNGQEKGVFSKDVDPAIFALLFMGSVRVSMLKWRNEGFSYSLTEKADHIADDLFKILKKTD